MLNLDWNRCHQRGKGNSKGAYSVQIKHGGSSSAQSECKQGNTALEGNLVLN